MSACWLFNRSADHLARWFSTGVDGARRSSRAEYANHRSLDDIAPGLSINAASTTLVVGDDTEQPAAISYVPAHRSAINRHSAYRHSA